MFWHLLTSGAGGFGAFDFEEFSGAHIVEVAVDWNGLGDERMIADAGDVVEHGLFLVADGEPLDVFTGAGARALRSEEHTSELQSPDHHVCRLLLEKKTMSSWRPQES